MLLLIVNAVESQSTLAAATCVCRTFQDEAERLLYRKVSLHGANDIFAFHDALTRIPRRASFVRSFEVKDDGRIAPAIPKLLGILPRLTHLMHLALYLDVCFEDDAPINSGVGAVRENFLTETYLAAHPEGAEQLEKLRNAIDEQVRRKRWLAADGIADTPSY